MIERHHDVGADDLLRLDAALRTQTNQGAVDVAREFGIFLAQRAASGQREDLVAARIGEHGSRPVHEPMDAAEFLEDVETRSQQQVVGVGEQDLRTTLEEIFTALGSNRRMRTYGHEGRRQYLVVLRGEARGAGARILGRGFEREMQPPRGGARHFTASFADDTTLLT